MSYILDALKKSEAERDPVTAANLALTEQRRRSRSQLLIAAITVGLLANAAVLAWIFGRGASDAVTPTPHAAISATQPQATSPVRTSLTSSTASAPMAPTGTPSADAAAPPTATRQPTIRGVAPAQPDQVVATVTAPSRATARKRLRLAELPTTTRNRFPGLAFSTHVYADDPTLRAIVANGERLGEGDEIGGARVEQITEDGVLMAFEEYLVEIPVISDWD